MADKYLLIFKIKVFMEQGVNLKHHLSTEGYYFMYRPDRNDNAILRATLYREKSDEIVDDVRVSEGYGKPEKNHHNVINYFEARLTLGTIR